MSIKRKARHLRPSADAIADSVPSATSTLTSHPVQTWFNAFDAKSASPADRVLYNAVKGAEVAFYNRQFETPKPGEKKSPDELRNPRSVLITARERFIYFGTIAAIEAQEALAILEAQLAKARLKGSHHSLPKIVKLKTDIEATKQKVESSRLRESNERSNELEWHINTIGDETNKRRFVEIPLSFQFAAQFYDAVRLGLIKEKDVNKEASRIANQCQLTTYHYEPHQSFGDAVTAWFTHPALTALPPYLPDQETLEQHEYNGRKFHNYYEILKLPVAEREQQLTAMRLIEAKRIKLQEQVEQQFNHIADKFAIENDRPEVSGCEKGHDRIIQKNSDDVSMTNMGDLQRATFVVQNYAEARALLRFVNEDDSIYVMEVTDVHAKPFMGYRGHHFKFALRRDKKSIVLCEGKILTPDMHAAQLHYGGDATYRLKRDTELNSKRELKAFKKATDKIDKQFEKIAKEMIAWFHINAGHERKNWLPDDEFRVERTLLRDIIRDDKGEAANFQGVIETAADVTAHMLSYNLTPQLREAFLAKFSNSKSCNERLYYTAREEHAKIKMLDLSEERAFSDIKSAISTASNFLFDIAAYNDGLTPEIAGQPQNPFIASSHTSTHYTLPPACLVVYAAADILTKQLQREERLENRHVDFFLSAIAQTVKTLNLEIDERKITNTPQGYLDALHACTATLLTDDPASLQLLERLSNRTNPVRLGRVSPPQRRAGELVLA